MRSFIRFLFNSLVPLVLVSAALAGAYYMLLTPPKTEKKEAEVFVPVVSVADLAPVDTPIYVSAYGVVIPARRVVLQPEVSGRVLEQHPQLIPGGHILEGEEILKIDPSEYEIMVRKGRADLSKAQASLDMEEGQQTIAKREWELLEEDLSEDLTNPSLVLRQPQLQSSEATRDAAQTALDEALLDLSRTILVAPFDSLVIQESVEVGQLVDRNTEIATLVGTKEFWIEAKVPLADLDRVQFPNAAGQGGSSVKVHLLEGNGASAVLEGRVLRLLGNLDSEGRMAQILVTVEDPLNYENDPGKRALLLESYVRLEIEAGEMSEVYPIPRTAMRENEKIWVCTPDNRLEIRQVDVVWRRDEDLLVRNRIKPGDRLIVSRLSKILPGMEVRIARERGESATSEVQISSRLPSDATEVVNQG
ncbi:MAG: efflux RND transporter periplasmic adaptor subunit [Candidatus Omnitrophica bacterium]|nr:efflux RND transporter periplasmic adaptor subunit [Candidatus Omnitrophota bacterium]